MQIFSNTSKSTLNILPLGSITAIKPATKNPNRAHIFIDQEFCCSLDISQIVDLHLKVGLQLGPEQIAELKSTSEFGKLYQRTLEWVIASPRSIKETRDYLKRKQYRYAHPMPPRPRPGRRFPEPDQKPRLLPPITDQMIEAVVERLVERKFLDDQKYAKYYTEYRMVRKGASRRKILQDLASKGVNYKIAEAALLASGRTDTEEIQKIIAKKRHKYDNAKLINYLVRHGFDYATAKAAVLGTD